MSCEVNFGLILGGIEKPPQTAGPRALFPLQM